VQSTHDAADRSDRVRTSFQTRHYPGLAGVRAQVADELVRAGEARDVSNGSQHARGDDRVHSADRHQPPDVRVFERSLCEVLVDHGQLGREAVDLVQMPQDETLLIPWQRQLLQPRPTLLGEQVAGLARDEVRMKDRPDSILQPSRASAIRAQAILHQSGSIGETGPKGARLSTPQADAYVRPNANGGLGCLVAL
jgi:hypothetical protein